MEAAPVTWHALFETLEGLLLLATLALTVVTGALAGGTFWMARRTTQVARATEREVGAIAAQVEIARDQVEIEKNALEATFRPLLVSVPQGYGAKSTGGWIPASEFVATGAYFTIDKLPDGPYRVSIPVRNAGQGIAFVDHAAVEWRRRRYRGQARNAIVPQGDLTYLDVKLPAESGIDSPGEREFPMTAVYTDLGGRTWQTTIDVTWKEAGGWMIAANDVRAFGAPDDQAVRSGHMRED